MPSEPLSADSLRRAIEGRDAETLTGFYRPDAIMQIIDRDHPPSHPTELRGRDAIAAHLADVCGRAMTHRVDEAVQQNGKLAFRQSCAYPDGTRVACLAMLDLQDGQIARQTTVQVWDQ
jgi:hypothetical protein